MAKYITYSDYLRQKLFKVSALVDKIIYLFFVTLLGSLLLALSSRINFTLPFTPVPFTMQTFVVLFLTMLLGRKVLYVLCMYVFEGIIGLPVFSKGSGFIYLLGPTGGYIVGFFVAGYICGILVEYGFDRSFVKTVFTMILGNLVIYIFGTLWLLRFVNFDVYKAISVGVMPFIVGDLVKVAVAALVLPFGWKKLEKY
ncbi:MAG: biotin transporter BioY [Endomicrobia bacterium]|nr:biotin transporter BioY [Endomicrobiia bacterium]